VTVFAALVALVFARSVFAGPPLLCHPFDIGSATSLPWDGQTWFQGEAGYKLANLVSDTDALLTPTTPVIVRMETLRRAAIYASRDPQVARTLLDRLTARARASETAQRPDALALLDAAYVTEALRQVTILSQHPEFRERVDAIRPLVKDADGEALMARSLVARPGDASLEFAAALISAEKDRAGSLAHAGKARAGAKQDPLLLRNLDHLN